MAKPRKPWSQLKPETRARKQAYYKKQGLSPGQIARRYNAGSLGSQAAARGHKQTPEHPQLAFREPAKYRRYLARKEARQKNESDFDYAIRYNTELDSAYRSMRRLSDYIGYNNSTVLANVYGGTTDESGDVPGMSLAQASWTASADIEEIRSQAADQYTGNPWFYH